MRVRLPRPSLRMVLWLLLGLVGLSQDAAVAAGGSYYVSAAGNDSNDGSSAYPFRQIRRALTAADAGDTIVVGDGTYLGFDIRGRHGTAGSPITIRASGSGAVVQPTTDRADNRDTIFVTYSSFIVLDGLRSSNANRAAVRIDWSNHVTIRNCVFANNARWGIFTDFSDDLVIAVNECYGSRAEHGIYVSNSGDRPTLRGNRCYDNYACGIHMNGDLSAGGDGIISGALVEDNLIYSNGAGGGAGINMDGVQNSLVRNNLLFNNRASGIACFRIDGAAGPSGLQILNNTVDQASGGRWALLFQSASGPCVARNNILYNRGTYRGGLLYGGAADVAALDSDYNIMDRVSPDDVAVLTLAQWKAQGREPNSLSATPAALWMDTVTGNYRLRSDSPAVDRGAARADVLWDLERNLRPSGAAFDIGCYELQSAPSAPSVTPSVTTTTPGGALSVTWAAPSGHPATDWIGLYRVGDPNTGFLWFQYTTSATSATINLSAPMQTGSYEFRYLANNSFVDTARSSAVTVSGAGFTVTAGATGVTAGAPLSANWTAPAGHSATDWVALIKVGDPNTSYVWWQSTGSATAGSLNLNAPTSAGDYEFRYLLNGRYTDVARSAKVTISGSAHSVTPGVTTVAPGGALSVTWTAPSGHSLLDWIGLYRTGDPNLTPIWYQYTTSATSATINLPAPMQPGTYQFRYLLNNGYTHVAQSVAVTVAASTYSVTAGATTVSAGAALSVNWTAPAGHAAVDWVGLFRVGDPNTLYGWWQYTGANNSGTFNLTAPAQAGQYEFRYLLNKGYRDAARSVAITVN